MRLLVTGATGFVGQHLIKHLLAHGGYEPIGLARSGAPPDAHVPIHAVDLIDVEATASLLRVIRPDAVIHLAGYANAGRSFREPAAVWKSNLDATLGLYRAVESWGGQPRVLFVSSGMVYGNSLSSGQVCDESMPLLPNSPYGASKAAADLASYQHYCHPGLQIIRVRPFNQIGAGQGAGFAVADFAEQIVRFERGQLPPVLETGNLESERDLTDVRDMVRAYRLLIEWGQPGEVYNAGRGQAVSMRSIVDQLVQLSGRAIAVQCRDDRRRPSEVTTMRVNSDRLRVQTGWVPEIPLGQTLRDVLEDWRQRNCT